MFLKDNGKDREKLGKKCKNERTRGRKEENKSKMDKCVRPKSFTEGYIGVCIELA